MAKHRPIPEIEASLANAEAWLTHPLVEMGLLSALPVQGAIYHLKRELEAARAATP